MSNFNPELKTDEDFLNERYCRELMSDNLFWCTTNMTEEEIRMSIIADLLAYTFWNIDNNTKLNITFEELVRFVKPLDVERIRQQLEHDDIKHLIVVTDGIYGLKEGREVHQAAMDYCGNWYEGYKIPDDETVICVNQQAFKEVVSEVGGIENLATSLGMDLVKTNDVSTKVN